MSEVFIVGAPRSGTTLLQSILATHSEFYSVPETFFFSHIIPCLGAQCYNPDHPVTEQDIEAIKQNFKSMTGFDVPETSQLSAGMSVKTAFESLLSTFNSAKKPRWLEKTPNHAKCLLAIRRFYPKAKFIHIVRDPVDSVASMVSMTPASLLDVRIRYVSSYYGQAKLWNESLMGAFLYPNQNNILHIFYEQLVMEPRQVIHCICNFLSVKFEDVLLKAFHETAAQLVSRQYSPWQQNILSPGFDTNAVHKWRRQLSPYHVWLIQRYTENLARYVGYYQEVAVRSNLLKLLYLTVDRAREIICMSRVELFLRKVLGKLVR